jgi:hypothetical protein
MSVQSVDSSLSGARLGMAISAALLKKADGIQEQKGEAAMKLIHSAQVPAKLDPKVGHMLDIKV